MEAEVGEVVIIRGASVSFVVFNLESLVGLTQCIQIYFDRLVSIDCRVLNVRIGLVKVIGVVHEGASHVVKDNRGVGTNQHGDAAGTSCRASATFWVNSDISGHH